jgi:hypothetical protein
METPENNLIDIYRGHFDDFFRDMEFGKVARALKGIVIFLIDQDLLVECKDEIRERVTRLEKATPMMNFTELDQVTKAIRYARAKLSAIDPGPKWGRGLSREATTEERTRLAEISATYGDSAGSPEGSSAPDSFADGLRDDDLGDD